MATGKPITYTVPGATQTSSPDSSSSSQAGESGPNIAAIVAGVIAGCLAILAAYLGFCTYVYRRQLTLYKQHVAAAQRSSTGSGYADKSSFFLPPYSGAGNPGGNGGGGGRQSAGGSSQATFSSPAAAAAHAFAEYSQHQRKDGETGSVGDSTEDLLAGQEPTFLGVMLNPRRSLRVINKD